MTQESPPSHPPAGWYQAADDPPNTERYWDGLAWQSEVRSKQIDNGAELSAVRQPSWQAPMPDALRNAASVISVIRLVLVVGGAVVILAVRSFLISVVPADTAEAAGRDITLAFLPRVMIMLGLVGVLLVVQLVMARTRDVGKLALVAAIIGAIDITNLFVQIYVGSYGTAIAVAAFVWFQVSLALRANATRMIRQTLSESTFTGKTIVRRTNVATTQIEEQLEREIAEAPDFFNDDGSFNMDGIHDSVQ